jgi:hypothetical protein
VVHVIPARIVSLLMIDGLVALVVSLLSLADWLVLPVENEK